MSPFVAIASAALVVVVVQGWRGWKLFNERQRLQRVQDLVAALPPSSEVSIHVTDRRIDVNLGRSGSKDTIRFDGMNMLVTSRRCLRLSDV